MKSVQVKILNKLGLHARPAMTFAEKAGEFSSSVHVRRTDGGETVDGKSIMQILMLAATCGTRLEIQADGDDEASCLEALKTLVDSRFEEDE